jgi:hypothetical protein
MKALLIKTDKGLRGATPVDHAIWTTYKRRLDTLPSGKYLRIESAVPRNGQHHKKLMALLQLVTENSETYNTIEKALVAIKVVSGYTEPFIDPISGKLTQLPKSIAYESMDQVEFEKFYSAAIDGVLSFILPQLDSAQADKLINIIVEGWA